MRQIRWASAISVTPEASAFAMRPSRPSRRSSAVGFKCASSAIGVMHEIVIHSSKEWVRGEIHTQGINETRTVSIQDAQPSETDVPIERASLLDELIQAHLGQLGYTIGQLSEHVLLLEDEFRLCYMRQALRFVS